MKLHEDEILFTRLINFSANNLNIRPEFIEKDYWITRALQLMAQNPNAEKVVFKGGTSLSKAYRLTNRFSEDIDIAVIDADSFSGNQLKMLLKRLVKDMASDITEYLTVINRQDLIEQYELKPFSISVLDKRRTIVEKLVSLIRFSFEEDVIKALASKIRHFYDLYYLANDVECTKYIQSTEFQKDLSELLIHDQQEFDAPKGWQTKTINNSPLIKDFSTLWIGLRSTYQNELSPLAFSEIPDEDSIKASFEKIIKSIMIP
ncbi:MAG: nucleotidyl transferase AbiEii/AbiGii toxin family protein [Dysgonamonadaceae bacterium]|nr:nucleotidyl transferase AbiEii/AbiGii toxin family protein [Dysgonamonadaceae bacterium]